MNVVFLFLELMNGHLMRIFQKLIISAEKSMKIWDILRSWLPNWMINRVWPSHQNCWLHRLHVISPLYPHDFLIISKLCPRIHRSSMILLLKSHDIPTMLPWNFWSQINFPRGWWNASTRFGKRRSCNQLEINTLAVSAPQILAIFRCEKWRNLGWWMGINTVNHWLSWGYDEMVWNSMK